MKWTLFSEQMPPERSKILYVYRCTWPNIRIFYGIEYDKDFQAEFFKLETSQPYPRGCLVEKTHWQIASLPEGCKSHYIQGYEDYLMKAYEKYEISQVNS